MELFVLSKIAISEIDGTLIASGGSKKILKPWKAEDAQLVPYAFLYQLR
jgi:hypothetical protein